MPTQPSLLPRKRSRLGLGALGLAAFFLVGQLQLRKCRVDFLLCRLSTKPSGKLPGDPLSCTPLFASHGPYPFLDQLIPYVQILPPQRADFSSKQRGSNKRSSLLACPFRDLTGLRMRS